jgi:hypothetical protein
MVYTIKADVCGRVKILITQMINYCKYESMEEDYYTDDDDDILWDDGDDHFDTVTKYVNFITEYRIEYRKLLRLVYEFSKSSGSMNIIECMDTEFSSIEFIGDQHSDDLFDIVIQFLRELDSFDEVINIEFSKM